MKRTFICVFVSLLLFISLGSQAQNKTINEWWKYHYLSEEESQLPFDQNRSFTETDPPQGDIRQCAEYEPMQGVMIRYPFGIPMELIKQLAEVIQVTTFVKNITEENTVKADFQAAGVNLSNCNFVHAKTDSWWTRDYAPWFLFDGDKNPAICNFPYNRPRPNDDNIPVIMGESLNIPVYGMKVYQTGGNYMCDGYGKAAQTDLVYDENTQLTEEQIHQKHLAYLGIDELMVLEDPLADYIKHIDCWGKFLDVDKVMIAAVPESDPRYANYEATANYFKTHNSSYGKPYQVFRVMAPGNYETTPYTNCLIVNKHVFLPQSGSSYDAAAIAAYQEAMPGYTIHGILYDSWYNTDALHCRTRGIPDLGMLYIKHIPTEGDIEIQGAVEIESEVIAYSKETIYADSVLLNYQVNGGEWLVKKMSLASGDTYSSSIEANKDDVVNYYIYAADKSGRRIKSPMMGQLDPNTFTVDKQVGTKELFTFSNSLQIGPNPTYDKINLQYQLKEAAQVEVHIYDIQGRQVMDTYQCHQEAGDYQISFDTRKSLNGPLSNGTYFIQFISGKQEVSKKIMVIH